MKWLQRCFHSIKNQFMLIYINNKTSNKFNLPWYRIGYREETQSFTGIGINYDISLSYI